MTYNGLVHIECGVLFDLLSIAHAVGCRKAMLEAHSWHVCSCTDLSSGEGVLEAFDTAGRTLPVGSTASWARKKVLKNFWSKNVPCSGWERQWGAIVST